MSPLSISFFAIVVGMLEVSWAGKGLLIRRRVGVLV